MANERINYADVKASCDNLTALTSKVRDTIENINNAISKIKDPVWGEIAADSYVKKINALTSNLPEANKQLALAMLFLASCADGYQSVDSQNVESLRAIVGEDYILNYDPNAVPDVDLSSRVRVVSNATSTGTGSYSGRAVVSSVISAAIPIVETIAQTDSGIDYLGEGYVEEPTKEEKEVEEEINYKEKVNGYWKDQGSRYVDEAAVLKVEDEDRYLVTVSEKYGSVGDVIDIELNDDTTLKCVISDTKYYREVEGNETAFPDEDILSFRVLNSDSPTMQDIDLSNKDKVKFVKITGNLFNE